MEENWHGRIFWEKSGSFNKCDAVPKTAIFQLWADFDGNLALGFLIKLYIMIEQPFFDKPAKTACPGKIWLTFENFFRATRISHIATLNDPFSVGSISRVWSNWMDFILHILILLNCLNDLAIISLILDHSKVVEMHFWMIQSAKKEVFGGFLGFGLLDRVGIAYCVSS